MYITGIKIHVQMCKKAITLLKGSGTLRALQNLSINGPDFHTSILVKQLTTAVSTIYTSSLLDFRITMYVGPSRRHFHATMYHVHCQRAPVFFLSLRQYHIQVLYSHLRLFLNLITSQTSWSLGP